MKAQAPDQREAENGVAEGPGAEHSEELFCGGLKSVKFWCWSSGFTGTSPHEHFRESCGEEK